MNTLSKREQIALQFAAAAFGSSWLVAHSKGGFVYDTVDMPQAFKKADEFLAQCQKEAAQSDPKKEQP